MALLFSPYLRAADQSNAPIGGAFLSFYQTQTSTPQPIYADVNLTIPLQNPLPSDSNGIWPAIWLDDSLPAYKVVMQYPDTTTNPAIPGAIVPGPNGTLDPYNPLPNSTALFKVINPATAVEIAAGVTIVNYQYRPGNVLRYGADPTGVVDSTNAFNAATLASFPSIAPSAYRTAYAPAGQYKITSTVYVPTGTIFHGDGMSTYIDASAGFTGGTQDVFKMGWSLIAGVPTKGTIYLTGGFPPEIYGLFVNGGPAAASVVNINFPGALCHDIWFSAAGQAVYLGGGYFYNCEVDAGLTGMTVGPGQNQTVTNVRFFNQNTAINFDVATADIDNCIFNGCTIEYPKITGVAFGNGTVNVKGIEFIGCTFNNNPAAGVTSFANCINVTNSNTALMISGCKFHNWGKYLGGVPTGAIAVAGANAVVDIIGCLFDGAPTNALYTASTTALGVAMTSGTVRMSKNHFRNLPFGGGALFMSGALQCSVKIDGLIYDNVAATTAVNISNNNANSIFVASNIDGDGVTPFINSQAFISTTLKNMSRWFGGIGTSGGSNFVTFPYQQSGIFQITISANQNAAGSASYRKSRVDVVEKDNDTSTTQKSLLNFATLVQGANNTGSGGNAALTLTVEFGSVGGGTSIAMSTTGVLAVSWPSTYTSVSIDVQVIQSG